MKTRDPVEPVALCRRMCQDAAICTDMKKRKTKYVNRLTPVTALDKASENGVKRAARKALAPWLVLVASSDAEAKEEEEEVKAKSSAADAQPSGVKTEISNAEDGKQDERQAYTVS